MILHFLLQIDSEMTVVLYKSRFIMNNITIKFEPIDFKNKIKIVSFHFISLISISVY